MEKKEIQNRLEEFIDKVCGTSCFAETPFNNYTEEKRKRDYDKAMEDMIGFIQQELDRAREEGFTKEELECILKWRDACDGEFNGMTLLPVSGDDWGKEEDIESAGNKLEEMLSKLNNK